MKKIPIHLKSKKNNVYAEGFYCVDTGIVIVKKGSNVSESVSENTLFRGTNAIKKRRIKYTKNGIVKENVEFKSLSTAASFILGRSCDGPRLWKNKDGKSMRETMLEEK